MLFVCVCVCVVKLDRWIGGLAIGTKMCRSPVAGVADHSNVPEEGVARLIDRATRHTTEFGVCSTVPIRLGLDLIDRFGIDAASANSKMPHGGGSLVEVEPLRRGRPLLLEQYEIRVFDDAHQRS